MTNIDRFERARSLGTLALLRLRAEVLLELDGDATIKLHPRDLECLERVAAAPQPADASYLATFDRYLAGLGDDAPGAP